MITLETEFMSGDGGFSADPLTYKQLQRTGDIALYERSRDGKVKDYEVIVIRTEPKGKVQKFPGGVVKVLEDDIERYPSTGQWGKMAWSYCALGGAKDKFNTLLAEGVKEAEEEENPTPEKTITIPVGEFSVKELGEKNGVGYPVAFLFLKSEVEKGSVKFIREERRNAKGKATKLYAKA